MPLDDDLPTTPQNEWTEIADLVRGHVSRLAKTPGIRGDEVRYLIDAARLGLLLDVEARSFDRSTELMRQRNGFCH